MRELTFDYFKQKYNLSPELGKSDVPAPSNARRSESAIMADMRNVGLHNVGGPWQAPSALRHDRKRCDACLSKRMKQDSDCKQVEGTQNCWRCLHYYGRPCSWTRSNLLTKPMLEALNQSEVLPGGIVTFEPEVVMHEIED